MSPRARIYCAVIILSATLAGAVWLLTYRVWSVVEYIDPLGRHFHPSELVRVSPWWNAYAAVLLTFVGVGISAWLLPGRRDLIRRFADRLGMPLRGPPHRQQ